MKVSLVSVCYQRFDRYEEILSEWMKQADEILVFDNSGKFKTDLDVTVISSTRNFGPQGKYPLGLYARNNIVMFADDDIMPKPGLVEDYLKYYKHKYAIGILGRVFDGKSYYGTEGSTGYWGHEIDKLQQVDWLGGGLTMVSRGLCGVPVMECPHMTIDDMWWEHHFPENIEMYVIPTDKYEFLEEGYKDDALHKSDEIVKYREEYYKKWFGSI